MCKLLYFHMQFDKPRYPTRTLSTPYLHFCTLPPPPPPPQLTSAAPADTLWHASRSHDAKASTHSLIYLIDGGGRGKRSLYHLAHELWISPPVPLIPLCVPCLYCSECLWKQPQVLLVLLYVLSSPHTAPPPPPQLQQCLCCVFIS